MGQINKKIIHCNNSVSIFTDGGARGNPGHAAIGVVFYDKPGNVTFSFGKYIGIATNNAAEYLAIYDALKAAEEKKIKNILLYTDSSLAFNQLNGNWKIKNEELKKLIEDISKIVLSFESFKIFYVPREENKEADKLVNKALNDYLKRNKNIQDLPL